MILIFCGRKKNQSISVVALYLSDNYMHVKESPLQVFRHGNFGLLAEGLSQVRLPFAK